jgi:monofunctional chorismate mutase
MSPPPAPPSIPAPTPAPTPAPVPAELSALRERIDDLDARWIELLAARFAVTDEVGRLKAAAHLPASDPAREAEQVRRYQALATQHGLPTAIVERIFRLVIDEVVARHRAAAAGSVVIAPIALAHAASFRACLDTVARERRYLAQTEALPLERIEGFVRDSVAADAVQFVALDGDSVVGWADVFPSWAAAVAHCGQLGMGVLPAWRGRGVGRRLLQACIDKAWAKGLTRIELEARADNHAAIALYRQLGFQHEALKHRAMRFDGVYFDAVQMSLVRPDVAPS